MYNEPTNIIKKFSYNDYTLVRRIPNQVGDIWRALAIGKELKNNEGFYCRSNLDGSHMGKGETAELLWIVAKDETGNYLIAKPKE